MSKIIKIAITGVECSGKTTLAAALAAHYQTTWVKEAARKYLADLQRDYNLTDIDNILTQQLANEQQAILNENQTILNENQTVLNRYLFCDTDPLVAKIWAEYKFGAASSFINNSWELTDYGLYLLCDFDIEWKYDPLREINDRAEREKLFYLYKNYLKQYGKNYVIIKGDLVQRIKQVDLLLKINNNIE
jgi:nicotinamide riboside kinase